MKIEFSAEEINTIDKILKLQGSIKIPFKHDLIDWYSPHGVSIHYKADGYNELQIIHGDQVPEPTDPTDLCKYMIFCEDFPGLAKYFKTIQEAFSVFEFYLHPKNNVGIAQALIMADHPELLAHGELDDPPVLKEFRKLLKNDQYNF